MLSIVSLLSFKSPFVLPLDKKDEANRAKQRLADDSASDHMVPTLLPYHRHKIFFQHVASFPITGIITCTLGLSSNHCCYRHRGSMCCLSVMVGRWYGVIVQALLGAYDGWREAQRSHRERDFCWRHFLSASTLRMVHQMRHQFMTLLQVGSLRDHLGLPPTHIIYIYI